jgi:hypothetical protein
VELSDKITKYAEEAFDTDMITTAWKYVWDVFKWIGMNKSWVEGSFHVKHEKVQNLSL